jgi:hypothetical protein
MKPTTSQEQVNATPDVPPDLWWVEMVAETLPEELVEEQWEARQADTRANNARLAQKTRRGRSLLEPTGSTAVAGPT